MLSASLTVPFSASGKARILGEEEGELHGASGRRWILDPIDGTFAFVHGVPFYGVLIALEIEGELSVGVVTPVGNIKLCFTT